MTHKAGFVSIIGKPNAGKSTLINGLLGEKLSIITYKAQTTRHRILGIMNDDDYQIVFSDTPGIIVPKYGLQKAMMTKVDESMQDCDVVLLVADIGEKHLSDEVREKLEKTKAPVIILLNKMDLSDDEGVKEKVAMWEKEVKCEQVLPVSALHKFNLDSILQLILKYLPESPAYYDKEQWTDKPEKFFAAEILREKIFTHYKEEVPYSTEVEIEEFKDEPTILRIGAVIYVARDSQKPIIIGKGGVALKNVGTAARKDLENFFGKKVFLQTYVRVKDNWRDSKHMLRQFGYEDPN